LRAREITNDVRPQDVSVREKLSTSRRHWILIAVISVLYILSRYGNLDRELTFEEGFFLAPGVEFFHTGHYHLYWGELDRALDPFHKPPLSSLLLGLFSFVSFDPVAGARIVPFLVGWFVCIAPLILTGNWVPSALVLLSPFLYGASSHMQTDPTGVLLGYSLVTIAVVRWTDGPDRANRIALISGFVILWLTRIESGAMATAAIGLLLLLPRAGRGRLLKDSVAGVIAGLLLMVLACSVLASTTGITPGSALASVFGTVTRIVSQTVGRHIEMAGAGARSRAVLFEYARNFKLPVLLALCWLPATIVSIASRRNAIHLREFASLSILFLVPLTATFAIAYVGDGFPRYLLIVIPPSLFILGRSIQILRGRVRLATGTAIALLAAFLMGPATLLAVLSSGSPSAFRGESGSRVAAELVRSLTRDNDLILAPEGEIFYLRDRRVLNIESFEPYPDRYHLAKPYGSLLRAAIIRRKAPMSAVVEELLGSLEARGAVQTDVDSYSVYVFSGSERNPPECAKGAAPVINSAKARRVSTSTAEWTIRGQCWDVADTKVVFTGRGCESGCLLPAGAISSKSASRVAGVAELPPGRYMVKISGKDESWSTAVPIDIPGSSAGR